jgi:hypothetical protein
MNTPARAKVVKHFTHRKNRQATREALAHERYDDIPTKDHVKKEDPLAWD